MGEIYSGVGGTARKIKGAYVGVNGVARKITKVYAGVNNVARQIWSGSGLVIGESNVGDTISIKVGGVPYDFIVVQKGSPSNLYVGFEDSVTVLMKDCYDSSIWGTNNDYENSTIFTKTNTDILNLIDNNIKNNIKEVKIPYRPGAGNDFTVASGQNGLLAKCFILSHIEINFTGTLLDGTALQYFSDTPTSGPSTKRVGIYNNSSVSTALRSPNGASTVFYCSATGARTRASNTQSYYYRPAFVLPADFVLPE